MSESKALTVAELTAILDQLPQDALVQIEGCDCQGWAHRVTTRGDTVWIRREDGEEYDPDGPQTWPAERRNRVSNPHGDDDA